MRKWNDLPKEIINLLTPVRNFIKSKRANSSSASQAHTTLRIAGYNIILMDREGDVVWTKEWDAGGSFEFGPNYNMWIFCEFTNHSKSDTEIAEYEIELVSEDGIVIERFGNAFSDSVIVVPGQSKVFSGQWRL